MAELEKIITDQIHKGKDLVLRYTNDFFIILQNCNKNSAFVVQGRIEQAIRSCCSQIHLGEDVEISFGVATYPDEANSYQELVNKAKQV